MKPDRIAPGGLGLIHRRVGPAQDVFLAGLVV